MLLSTLLKAGMDQCCHLPKHSSLDLEKESRFEFWSLALLHRHGVRAFILCVDSLVEELHMVELVEILMVAIKTLSRAYGGIGGG